MPPSIQFITSTEVTARTSSIYTRPQKKQKMSITQTYFLAHSARGKLSKEASRADHDLRLLVGHANLLDSLMVDLATAEQEQEQWFTKSVSQSEEAVEEPEADWEAKDAEESDSDYDEDEEMIAPVTQVPVISITNEEEEEEEFEDDDEEDYEELALTRTTSRYSPPELSSDSESDSDDEHMPPSPPSSNFDVFTENRRAQLSNPPKDSSLSESQQEAFVEEGFFLPSRSQPQQQPQTSMIAVY